MKKGFWISLLFLFLVLSAKVYAAPISGNMAVKIIVSEASDQGLKGFYGYRRYGWANEPKSIWDLAKIAWAKSKYTNYTRGADHFMSVHTSSIPSWIRYCVKTYAYKDHIFFKEIYHRHNNGLWNFPQPF